MPVIDINESNIQKYIESKRPPEDVRDKVDIGCVFENNTLEIFEIRPAWDNKAT